MTSPKQEAKRKIGVLIDKYEKVVREGRLKSYNEAQTLNEFIEPFFEHLGWDIRNIKNDEVSKEEAVSHGRIDLGFRIHGIPKFFLEAKSLKSDLDIKAYADQAINYSWNKGVNWAILTDFESLKVYNAQAKSQLLQDKLVFEISYKNYLKDFDRIWLLSKDNFLSDELESYAIKFGKKIKKQTVNERLYEDLKKAREILTEAFHIWDPKIDKITLDEGVQRILDRLVFMRVLEDRKLEPPTLKPILRDWENNRDKQLFSMLIKKFREIDKTYNSNLFKKHACEEWEEYSDAIADVIRLLYGDSIFEYDFSYIPSDILGGTYESYLSYISQNPIETKKIKSKNKGKKLELKFESRQKRKKQGIYYTPKFIVDFIAENTLGKKLESISTIHELQKMKVLDPACGSGSFLVKALELIDDKYKDLANREDFYTKSTIVLTNIYGIDLDPQAIELAKLNLLIDVLDKRTKLPDIGANVCVGNSLISKGPKDLTPFNYREEFKEVFDQGGFDVIIGNPPYIKEYTNRSAFDELHDSPYYQGKMDIWTLFACRAIDLLKDGGYLSFIAPNNWLTNAGASIFRKKILSEGQIIKFVDFGDFKVFEDAGIQTMIFVFKKSKPKKSYQTTYAKVNSKNIGEDAINLFLQSNLKDADGDITKYEAEINPQQLAGKNIVFSNQINDEILKKIESKKNFELTGREVAQGIVAAPDKYFIIKDLSGFEKKEREFIKSFHTSTAKYTFSKTNLYIFYFCDKNFGDKNIINYPNIKNHFEPFKQLLKEAKRKYGTPDKPYFYLHREREEKFFQKGPKVVGQTRTAYPSFLYTEEEYYGSRAMNFIKTDRINLKYLTGIFNSRLSCFWLKNKGKQLGDLLQIDKGPLLNIPLIKPAEKTQNKIALLVEKVIKLYQDFRNTPANTDKWHSLKKEIENVEKQIDQKVYKLYGLMDEEIKIVGR